MIISSWNVNSVRARIENIKSYLLKYKPDVVMMQEIKTEDINFPYDDFSALNYESQCLITVPILFFLKYRSQIHINYY